VQEEPKNMGGWNFISNRISNLISANQELICVSRPEGASPAVGSAKLSNQQQKHIIEQSFSI
jgi:2-oxoglutarate dehydrogenase E1 component